MSRPKNPENESFVVQKFKASDVYPRRCFVCGAFQKVEMKMQKCLATALARCSKCRHTVEVQYYAHSFAPNDSKICTVCEQEQKSIGLRVPGAG